MHDSVNLHNSISGYTQVKFRGIFNVEKNFCFDFDKGQRNLMYLKGLYGNMFYFGRKKEKNQNKNHMLYKCVMQWCIDLNYTI